MPWTASRRLAAPLAGGDVGVELGRVQRAHDDRRRHRPFDRPARNGSGRRSRPRGAARPGASACCARRSRRPACLGWRRRDDGGVGAQHRQPGPGRRVRRRCASHLRPRRGARSPGLLPGERGFVDVRRGDKGARPKRSSSSRRRGEADARMRSGLAQRHGRVAFTIATSSAEVREPAAMSNRITCVRTWVGRLVSSSLLAGRRHGRLRA